MQHIYDTKAESLRLEIAGMLDMRKELVSTTYELEGDRLEIMLIYERVEALRAVGNSLRSHTDGILPNVDAVIRRLMELKPGVKIEKYFQGAGFCVGTLKKKEEVESELYPGQERDAWLVEYADGHTEHFEEEELRSGKDGPAPANQDGKPVLVVRHLQKHKEMYDAFVLGFDYLEARIAGTCDAQYSCAAMYEVARVARAFNPNFATNHLNPAFVDAMVAITPLASHGLISQLKNELPLSALFTLQPPRVPRCLTHRTWRVSQWACSTGGVPTASHSLSGRRRRVSLSPSRRTRQRASASSRSSRTCLVISKWRPLPITFALRYYLHSTSAPLADVSRDCVMSSASRRFGCICIWCNVLQSKQICTKLRTN